MMKSPMQVYGVELCTTGHPTASAWLSGTPTSDGAKPECELLPRRAARRLSLLTRMVCSVAEGAASQAKFDLGNTPTILASSLGELRTTEDLLDSMFEHGGELSPIRFQYSVHNAALGVLSIHSGNQGFGTVISAGYDLLAMAFIEAGCFLAAQGGAALVIAAEDTWGPGFNQPDFDPLALAFAVTYEKRADAVHLGSLTDLRVVRDRPPPHTPIVPLRLRDNPCAGGIGLIDSLLQGKSGPVRIDVGHCRDPWVVDVDCGET